MRRLSLELRTAVWCQTSHGCFYATMFISKAVKDEVDYPATPAQDTRITSILLSNGFFITLVTLITTLRIYAKHFLAPKHLFLDDCKLTPAACDV